MAADAENNHGIRAIERAMAVISLFSFERPELGVSEIARELGLYKSTVHRILTTLEKGGFIEKHPKTSTYRLGMKLFEAGSIVLSQMGLQSQAMPVLERLAEATRETSHLMVLHQGEVLYLAKFENEQELRLVSKVGMRVPANCTAAGRVLLASLGEQELEAIVRERGLPRRTPYTICDMGELKKDLELIRVRGYAVDDQQATLGVRCVAAPVRDYTGRVVAAISVSGPVVRIPDGRIPELAETVIASAREISSRLGHRSASVGL